MAKQTTTPTRWVRTLTEQVCSDCGKLGCLIPVTHGENGGLLEALYDFNKRLIESQRPLDEVSARVLRENAWDLYE